MENENKMVIECGELCECISYEIERLQENYTSNSSKNINKMELLLQFLMGIPQAVTFTLDGVRGNGDIRDFTLPNAGSIVECAVKYYTAKTAIDEVSKAFTGVDMKKGNWNVEIKASLTANSLATPSERETTILVNRLGVWQIKRDEVLKYTTKSNRLPHNVACGRLLKGLSMQMGFQFN